MLLLLGHFFFSLMETQVIVEPNFVNKAAEEKVIVFCLPPNSTHRTQTLDKGAFSPLKIIWREECHALLSKSGSIFIK